MSGITSCESYPSPLPDLFTGLPLLVSGRFTGAWPESVVLRGLLPDGKRYSQKVRARLRAFCHTLSLHAALDEPCPVQLHLQARFMSCAAA